MGRSQNLNGGLTGRRILKYGWDAPNDAARCAKLTCKTL